MGYLGLVSKLDRGMIPTAVEGPGTLGQRKAWLQGFFVVAWSDALDTGRGCSIGTLPVETRRCLGEL